MADHPLDGLDRSIVAFSGNFGSGKSEVAVNTALSLSAVGRRVAIVDLDVVNPYFRCREARMELEARGVEVVAPPGEYSSADLPIILPEIRGRILDFDGTLILDVGGDDVGARALASLGDVMGMREHHFLMVLNERRPFTGDLASASATLERIEASAGLEFTGLVGNTHLMEHTTVETVMAGIDLLRELSAARDLPIIFVAVERSIYDDVVACVPDLPLLPLVRNLRPPWQESPSDRPGPAAHAGTSGSAGVAPRPGRPWGTPPRIELPGRDTGRKSSCRSPGKSDGSGRGPAASGVDGDVG